MHCNTLTSRMVDEDLAKALNMQVKEVTKAAGKLKAERLIKM